MSATPIAMPGVQVRDVDAAELRSHAANASSTSLDSPASAWTNTPPTASADGLTAVVDVDAADPRAFGGEPLGGRLPDARRRAGDERDLPVQLTHLDPPWSTSLAGYRRPRSLRAG